MSERVTILRRGGVSRANRRSRMVALGGVAEILRREYTTAEDAAQTDTP
jgi:hypothetical protein